MESSIFLLPGATSTSPWTKVPAPPLPPGTQSSIDFNTGFTVATVTLFIVIILFTILHYYIYRLRQHQTTAFDIEAQLQSSNSVRLFVRFQAEILRQRAQRRTEEEEEEATSSSATSRVGYKEMKRAACEEEEGDLVECAICIEGFEEEEICKVVERCGHFFHESCLDQWLKVQRHCPLCRCLVQVLVVPPQDNSIENQS